MSTQPENPVPKRAQDQRIDYFRAALKDLCLIWPGNHPDYEDNNGSPDLDNCSDEALVDLLRDSIECWRPDEKDARIADLKRQLAARGEPVAWCVYANGVLDFLHASKEACENWLQYSAARTLHPLYLAPPAPVVPEGWQLVPKEPTVEMVDAMNRVLIRHNTRQYEAALAAAPKPEQAP